MHSIYSRVSTYSGVLFNATTVLLLAIALVTHLSWKPLPEANLTIIDYTRFNGKTLGVMFNPGVDLTSQFDSPNLKQIFLYLNIKYGKNLENSEMVWSKIVTRQAHKIYKSNLKSNYDLRGNFGKKAIFELRANFFPYVGVITDKQLAIVEKI
ncbi:hypothetical protein TCON_2445 [Astathelohania contejeani]|uniref:Signal peptidase complex subunit 3 n=1 Tax=Astathelohania contejeani TaxID=164912 RepID=A0ABQ7HW02_9MICR|nr:hypothetical protein TCON_2445 [Thelohania contejeani]